MPKPLEEKKDPVQLELPFPGPIQFKDCIAKISRKHGSRGSVLQQLLGDVCQDKPIFFGDWVLAQQEKESEEQGAHDV